MYCVQNQDFCSLPENNVVIVSTSIIPLHLLAFALCETPWHVQRGWLSELTFVFACNIFFGRPDATPSDYLGHTAGRMVTTRVTDIRTSH